MKRELSFLRDDISQLSKYQLGEVPMCAEWFKNFSDFIDDAWDTLSGIDDVEDLNLEDFLLISEIMYNFICTLTLSSDYPDFFDEPLFAEQKKKAGVLLEHITPDDYFTEKIISAFWEYADFERDACYYELQQAVQSFKIGRNKNLSPDVWGRMLADELRKNDTEDDGMEKRILLVCQEDRLLIDLDDEEFYDYFNTFITVENIESFLQLALRFSILMCETFPDTLKPQFEAWLKGEEASEPGLAQEEENQGANSANEEEVSESKDLVGQISQCFTIEGGSREENARSFLQEINGLDGKPLTDVVCKWLREGRINPDYCNSHLRKPLKEKKIYTCSRQNWDKRINPERDEQREKAQQRKHIKVNP